VCKEMILNKQMSKFCFRYNKIKLKLLISTSFGDALKFIMNARSMRKIPSAKYLRSWNLHPKPNLVICYWPSLFMLILEDPLLILHVWVLYTTIEDVMKKSYHYNIFLLLLDVWPKETVLVKVLHVTILATLHVSVTSWHLALVC
jgi:hypothetical protein